MCMCTCVVCVCVRVCTHFKMTNNEIEDEEPGEDALQGIYSCNIV